MEGDLRGKDLERAEIKQAQTLEREKKRSPVAVMEGRRKGGRKRLEAGLARGLAMCSHEKNRKTFLVD